MSIPEIAREDKEIHDTDVLAGDMFKRLTKLLGPVATSADRQTVFQEWVVFEEEGFEYRVVCFADRNKLGIKYKVEGAYDNKVLFFNKDDIGENGHSFAWVLVDYGEDDIHGAASLKDLRRFDEILVLYERARTEDIPFKEASWQAEL